MAAKSASQDNRAAKKSRGAARRVEEIHFFDYIKEKKDHKHIEEIGIEDFLKRKKASDSA